jgi:t-SNARE complex subunit (syntaxin)
MWDFFAKVLPGLVDFAKTGKKNSNDIEKIHKRLDELSEYVEKLDVRQQQAEARQEETERRHKMEMENLLLRLENILLRHGINPDSRSNILPEPPQKDAS